LNGLKVVLIRGQINEKTITATSHNNMHKLQRETEIKEKYFFFKKKRERRKPRSQGKLVVESKTLGRGRETKRRLPCGKVGGVRARAKG
jgi:hypothetical protein